MDINLSDQELKQLRTIYGLLWHYLRQSFWYKKFCEIMHDAEIATGETENPFSKADALFYSLYAENKIKLKLTHPPDLSILNSYWDFFGHIYLYKFNEWWKKKKSSLIKKFVVDLTDQIATEVFALFPAEVRRYRKLEGDKLPSPKGILEMITRDKEYVYVAIPAHQLTIGEIGKQIAEIRKKHRRCYPLNWTPWNNAPVLVGRKQIKELARYLTYYKMENHYELKKKQMIDKRQKADNNKADNEIKDEINQDIKRAQNIIRNVELGKFPGQYQPRKKKSKKTHKR